MPYTYAENANIQNFQGVKYISHLGNFRKWSLLVKNLMVFGLQGGPKSGNSSENVTPKWVFRVLESGK